MMDATEFEEIATLPQAKLTVKLEEDKGFVVKWTGEGDTWTRVKDRISGLPYRQRKYLPDRKAWWVSQAAWERVKPLFLNAEPPVPTVQERLAARAPAQKTRPPKPVEEVEPLEETEPETPKEFPKTFHSDRMESAWNAAQVQAAMKFKTQYYEKMIAARERKDRVHEAKWYEQYDAARKQWENLLQTTFEYLCKQRV